MLILSVLAIIAGHFIPEKNAGSKPAQKLKIVRRKDLKPELDFSSIASMTPSKLPLKISIDPVQNSSSDDIIKEEPATAATIPP